jgi:activating signal cointegrator complex subunit 3
VELTGDATPDMRSLLAADVIVATPEKWDGVSRAWAGRAYVRQVGLLVMDEIHLLGADRGPVLEVIVSRMRYVAAQAAAPVRFLGLSTALANAADLGDWLGVPPGGLFNFKPSVRPVPLECHIQVGPSPPAAAPLRAALVARHLTRTMFFTMHVRFPLPLLLPFIRP